MRNSLLPETHPRVRQNKLNYHCTGNYRIPICIIFVKTKTFTSVGKATKMMSLTVHQRVWILPFPTRYPRTHLPSRYAGDGGGGPRAASAASYSGRSASNRKRHPVAGHVATPAGKGSPPAPALPPPLPRPFRSCRTCCNKHDMQNTYPLGTAQGPVGGNLQREHTNAKSWPAEALNPLFPPTTSNANWWGAGGGGTTVHGTLVALAGPAADGLPPVLPPPKSLRESTALSPSLRLPSACRSRR